MHGLNEKTDYQISAFDLLLLQHSARLEQIDRCINYLTAIMPGQSAAMELAVEATVSSTALLNTYKNQVVSRLTKKTDKSYESRYLDAAYAANDNYRRLAHTLNVLKATELFIEMAATTYKGEKGRWRTILGVESLKAMIRLAMLCISQRILPSTVPIHESDLSPEDIQELIIKLQTGKLINSAMLFTASEIDYKPAPNNRKFPFLKSFKKDDARHPRNLLRTLNPQLALSEVLLILRPVIYAALLYKDRSKKRSWTPWLVGVGIEVLSHKLADSVHGASSPALKSKLEGDVYYGRARDMVWWLFRGPMFSEKVRPICNSVVNKLNKVPLLSTGGMLIEEYLLFLDEYYFASASL